MWKTIIAQGKMISSQLYIRYSWLLRNIYSCNCPTIILVYPAANQCGFKCQLSTDMCTFSMKQVIEYFNMYNSRVVVCYLNASKALDNINH